MTGETRQIRLNKGRFALIDADDFEWLNKLKWHVTDRGYAVRSESLGGGKSRSVSMHRMILDTPKGMVSDHINGDRLDNRRSNLRICTLRENAYNKSNCDHSSQYKGVGWKKQSNNWQARVRFNDKWMHIGIYEDEIAAAVAYNEKAKEFFGEFAKLNVIPPDWTPTAKSIPYRLKGVTSGKRPTFRGKQPTSKYKGVSKAHGRWKAVIKNSGTLHTLALTTRRKRRRLSITQRPKNSGEIEHGRIRYERVSDLQKTYRAGVGFR